MNRLAPFLPSTFALCAMAGTATAQNVYPEVELNNSKAQATVIPPLVAGDAITGQFDDIFVNNNTTGDVFLVQTAALPTGIYRHRLTLTAPSAPVQGMTRILGRAQVFIPGFGGVLTGQDAVVQGYPPTALSSSWYGFGTGPGGQAGGEKLYFNVLPTFGPTVATPYTLTLSTTPVPVTHIPQTFEPGLITISTINTSTADTSLHVYANLLPAIGANDDETLNSNSKQSYLRRNLNPGTYRIAVSVGGTAWGPVAEVDEHITPATAASHPTMDFLNVLARPNGPQPPQAWDFRITAANGVHTQLGVVPANPSEDILWFSFTVAANSPVIDDVCANATQIFPGETYAGKFAMATNDGGSACDSGGASSKDVWFKYTNTTPTDVAFRVNTCGSVADTALSIHTACGGTELACSDNCANSGCGTTTSCASVLMTSGQTIFVRVSDKGTGADYVLNTSIEPSNDECTAPQVLAGAGDHPIDNAFASTSAAGQTQSACSSAGGTGIARDLWYSYTPLIGGSVQITTCGLVGNGPSDDSKIAVYAGTACPTPGTAVACSDTTFPSCGGGSTTPATVTFNAACGTTYLIQIGMSPLSTSSLRGSFRIQEFGPTYGAWCYTPTTTFCTGDGAVPCPNTCALTTGGPGRGCPNSAFPLGAALTASGVASVSPGLDTLVLTATDITGPAQFIQSSTVHGGLVVSDGTLCLFQSLVRLGVSLPSAGGVASFPTGTGSSIYALGGPFAAGSTRYYQCWYRDAAPFCTSATNNHTSAIALVWYP